MTNFPACLVLEVKHVCKGACTLPDLKGAHAGLIPGPHDRLFADNEQSRTNGKLDHHTDMHVSNAHHA